MKELLSWGIRELISALKIRKISAIELAKAYIERAQECRDLNMYVYETFDLALKQAKESDERYARSREFSLDGIPIAVKDIFCTEGIRTTACSKMLENFIPPYESTVTDRLFKHGAVMIGKANMDEFAMGSSNCHSYFGAALNPWKRNDNPNLKMVPGGSSGGSAAAVAARACVASLGTDTGGSVRQPASFCGIVGAKPTYGRCSRYGIISFASSLDQAGVFARSVEDCAILFEKICGVDEKDPTTSPEPVPNFVSSVKNSISGMKIGIPKEYIIDGISDEILSLWNKGKEYLKDAGAQIVDISLPHTKYSLAVYYVIAPAEAYSNFSRYDGVRYGYRPKEAKNFEELVSESRGGGFGIEVKRRMLLGNYILSSSEYDSSFVKAQKVRRLIQNDFLNAFEQVDAILVPTAPSVAFDTENQPTDPVLMYLNDIFTVVANLAGLPGISVPTVLGDGGLPLGLQIISKPFDEASMFKIAHKIETAAQFPFL
ncbi:Glutamyl-tRNA(Gln) amidotransferase subunit A [Candidatus Cyrtobacter comes]|uniref:Glutamyl-tRNA(Gln) amidotransferase subunit A n=1 Tax=Candidatus Cyrtobacter comes TaxID=675776 RepID=A0ABU5L7M1_9RICK|nr:Asp-tRNA(Asn)/Glu-tRNA(Gln) amidotransferase subunit GatA [Candidatus Cyrtobacter comes]MDZ5762123.1 Glutamyl-tRNA(Gln) amidotransferase subunit A [Candidatus Cyrtobacter comes]